MDVQTILRMALTNIQIAQLLRKIAAAYQILNENRFKIIAYERAADSIEHLTREAKDEWDDGTIGNIPGIGKTIAGHLDELFRTGSVAHFDSVLSQLPASVFPLLLVPGLGPKKAYKLVTELSLDNEATVIEDLEHAAKEHRIAPMDGFGDKSEADILANIAIFRKGQIKENRMLLSDADAIAAAIIDHLNNTEGIESISILGSLRRSVSTIGDIDIAAATTKPEPAIDRFLTYPHQKMIERGPTGASILLHNGRQVDFRVQEPGKFGSMQQYFTGGKNHNIALRSFALKKNRSLNEYGIKNTLTNSVQEYASEKKFYESLGLAWIPPELREDRGEIEAARRSYEGKKGGLPSLITTNDMKGDFHVHTDYNLEPSHDLGADPIELYLDRAMELGYEYIGFSDHNPSVSKHTDSQIIDIMKRRKEYYEQKYYSWKHKLSKNNVLNHITSMFIMCEVDILADGALAIPDGAFDFVDAVIVSVHSSFTQDRATMTSRVIRALTSHPKVKIFGHPTARLLGKREGVDYDWDAIFDTCSTRHIALEINAHPSRLDVPDAVVYDAKKYGLSFAIDTDAHDVAGMDVMKFGVSNARRGWAEKHDIINTLGYNQCIEWMKEH